MIKSHIERLDIQNIQRLDLEFGTEVVDLLLTTISKAISVRNIRFNKLKEPFLFLCLEVNDIWFNLELAQSLDKHEWFILDYYIGDKVEFNPEFGLAYVVSCDNMEEVEKYFVSQRYSQDFDRYFDFSVNEQLYIQHKKNDVFNATLNKN